MKVWGLDKLFGRTKLDLRVKGKFLVLYLNDVYMTMCSIICIIIYCPCQFVQLCSCLKLHLKFCIKNNNFICIYYYSANRLIHVVGRLNRLNAK
jgi:hypothetical protein